METYAITIGREVLEPEGGRSPSKLAEMNWGFTAMKTVF